MTADVSERLARLEVQVSDLRADVGKIACWVDELRQRRAAWAPVETFAGRVLMVAIGAIVPVALAIVATWLRIALTSAP